MTTNVTITGDKEVMAALKALGAKAQPALVTAMKAGGLIVQNDAKVRAPKLTGNLARSIHMEEDKDGVAIGTDVVYAAAVEYGRPDMKNYPIQPYLRPALDQNVGRIAAIIQATLKKVLQL